MDTKKSESQVSESMYCQGCLEKVEQVNYSGDIGHNVVTCEKCDVKVHIRCNGEKNNYKKKKEKTKEVYYFECDKCQTNMNSKCVICLNQNGYMKNIGESKFVHLICAIFSDVFEISDYFTMTISPKLPLNVIDSLMISSNKKNKCSYCKNPNGLLLTCDEDKCNDFSHIYCMFESKIAKLKENPDSTEFWVFEWKIVKPEESVYTQIYEKKENKSDNKKTPKKSKKKVTKAQKEGNDLVESKFLFTNKEDNWFILNRGGGISVKCIDHREITKYCQCKKDYDENEFMICCDNCDVWYHGKCINLQQKDTKNFKFWLCHFCKDWINNKNNFLLKEIKDEFIDLLVKQATEKKWKNLVVHKHINYRIIDMIFIGMLFWYKSKVLINNLCSVEILENHLSIADEIPISFSSLVDQLMNKFHSIKNFNIIEKHQKELNKFLKSNFYSQDNEKFVLNTKKVEECEEYLNELNSQLSDTIKNSALITNSTEELENLISKLKWGLEASRLISQDKALLTDLKNLEKKHKEIFGNNIENGFEKEYKMISSYVEEGVNWQKTTKDLFNQSFSKNIPINNTLGFNDEEYENLLEIVRKKVTISDIEKLIQNSLSIHVNLKKETDVMKEYIKDSTNWDEKYNSIGNNIEDLEKVIKLMKDLLVSTPSMFRAVDSFGKYKRFFLKYQEIMKRLEIPNLDHTVCKEELTKLLDESSEVDVNISNITSKIKFILENQEELKSKAINMLSNECDVIVLKSLLKEMNDCCFIYKEFIEKLNLKINFIENFEANLSFDLDLSKIELIESKIKFYSLDERYTNILNEKKLKIIQIKAIISEILSNTESIPSQEALKKLFNDINENNLNIDEKGILEDYIKINDWIDKVKQGIIIKFNIIKDSFMEDSKSEENVLFNIETCQVEDLNFLEVEYVDYLLNEITPLSFKLKGISKEIYFKLLNVSWRKKVSIFDKTPENTVLDFELLKSCYLQGTEVLKIERNFSEESTERNLFLKVKELYLSFDIWDKNFEKLKILVFENFSNLEEIRSFYSNIIETGKNLLKHSEEKKIFLDFVEKFINISNKCEDFITRTNQAYERKPKHSEIKSLIEDSNRLLKEFKDFRLKTQEKLTFPSNSNFELLLIRKLKEELILYDFWIENFNKITNSKLLNDKDNIVVYLEKIVEDSKSLICQVDKELESLRHLIESYNAWTESAKKIIVLIDNFNYIPKNELEINQVKKLNSQTSNLPGLDSKLVEDLKTLEWVFKVNSSRVLDYRSALKLLQEGKTLKNFSEVISKKEFYLSLADQIHLARGIRDSVDSLKHFNTNGGKKISEENFETLLKDSIRCKLNLKEEKEYIENLSKNIKIYENKYSELISSKKSLAEFEKLFGEVSKFPVNFKFLVNVESIIQEEKTLMKEIKRLLELHKTGKLVLIKNKIEFTYKTYKNSKSSFDEGEILVKMYENSIENFEKLRFLVENFKNTKQTETQLIDIISILESLEIHFPDEEKYFKKEIWIKKYETFINDAVSPKYNAIKNLAIEGEELEMTDKYQYIKLVSLAETADKILAKINSAKNKEDLKKIKEDNLANANIDINEFLIEQETRLECNLINESNIGERMFLSNKRKPVEKEKKETNEDIDIEIQINDEDQKKMHEEKKRLEKNNSTPNPTTTSSTRPKRQINMKIDQDFLYEKEFLENLEKKIHVRNNVANPNPDKNTQLDETLAEKADSRKEIGVKANKPKPKPNVKDSIRKSSISVVESILNENKVFSKEGSEFISKLTKEFEEELMKSYPSCDENYKTAFNNIKKTIKELEKFPGTSSMIAKGRLSLIKVSKFPYGEMYIEKLKKIEEKSKKSNNQIPQTNQNPVSSQNPKIDKSKKKEDNSKNNLVNYLQDMDELYQPYSLDPKTKDLKKIQQLKSELTSTALKDKSTEDNSSLKIEDKSNVSDIESLKSISDNDVKFSPSNNNPNKKLSTPTNKNQGSIKEKSLSMDSEGHPREFKGDSNKLDKPYDPNDLFFDAGERKKIKNRIIFNPIFYDPTKNKCTTLKILKNSASKGSTLRVWKGIIDYYSVSFDSQLISNDNIESFQCLSNISDKMTIASRAKTKEVLQYIEKSVNSKSKSVLFSWLEVDEGENLENYKKLASEFDNTEKSGYFKIMDTKIYFLTLSEKNLKFLQKLKFDKINFYNDVMKKSEKTILGIFVSKKSNPPFNFLNPEVLIENKLNASFSSETEVQESVKTKSPLSQEKKQNMSPITSDEEMAEEPKTQQAQQSTQNEQLALRLDMNNISSLQAILNSDDLSMFEEYINLQFANLSQEELLVKLMQLDEVSRMKLLTLITEYQKKNEEKSVPNERNDVQMGYTESPNQRREIQMNQHPHNPINYDQGMMNNQYQNMMVNNNNAYMMHNIGSYNQNMNKNQMMYNPMMGMQHLNQNPIVPNVNIPMNNNMNIITNNNSKFMKK